MTVVRSKDALLPGAQRRRRCHTWKQRGDGHIWVWSTKTRAPRSLLILLGPWRGNAHPCIFPVPRRSWSKSAFVIYKFIQLKIVIYYMYICILNIVKSKAHLDSIPGRQPVPVSGKGTARSSQWQVCGEVARSILKYIWWMNTVFLAANCS